jgi:hypothetical protein
VIDLGRSCNKHRPVLVDFVDRGEVRPETGAALAHLDRCQRCTEAIESTMLTITALRRIGDEAGALEPAADAWPRLRIRIEAWPRRPALTSPLLGVAMSFAIVAALALPFRLTSLNLGAEATPTVQPGRGATPEERLAEHAYIAASRRAIATPAAGPTGSVRLNLPPEIWEIRKEAQSAKSSSRPPEPI